MRKSKAAVATPEKPRTALFDVSPHLQPFTWGRIPACDEALTIAGQPGVWSFRGVMECGALYQYVLLVRYGERMDAQAARVVVLAGWVLEEKQVSA